MRNNWIFLLGIALFSCTSTTEENLLYSYLEECNQIYYDNKNIDVDQELEVFHAMLVEENQLKNKSFGAFNILLSHLAKQSIFPTDQNIEIPQDHPFLKEPPQQLFSCVNDLYEIDSLQFTKTAYYELENEILNYLSTTSTPRVNYIWEIYLAHLTEENFAIPFYRKNILMQLFRWYYVCKYEKESLPLINNE